MTSSWPRKPQEMSPEDFTTATYALTERGEQEPAKKRVVFKIFRSSPLFASFAPSKPSAFTPASCEDIVLLAGYGSNPDTRHLSAATTGSNSRSWSIIWLDNLSVDLILLGAETFKLPSEWVDSNQVRLLQRLPLHHGLGFWHSLPCQEHPQIVGNRRAFGQPAAKLKWLSLFGRTAWHFGSWLYKMTLGPVPEVIWYHQCKSCKWLFGRR